MTSDPSPNVPEYSVSELSHALRRSVEDRFGHVRVRAELSGCKRAASGHFYFALKDADSVLDGVMWRGQAARLGFVPEDGLEVVCTGQLTTYAARSKYQIKVERMEPAGAGALMALLMARKEKLTAEGLFAAERKRPLPFLPQRIGVITSPTGAVIRDILHRLKDRFAVDVLLWPVRVQGDGAAEEVARAIAGMNALPAQFGAPPDLLIVARGGGSIEDLWAFNEEVVVRAAAASAIPLISAVGHETDTTLIDHAADQRAPTPTGAAEMAVPVRAELIAQTSDLARRMRLASDRSLREQRRHIDALARSLPKPRDRLGAASQRLDDLGDRLPRGLQAVAAERKTALMRLAGGLTPGRLQDRLAGTDERARALSARMAPALQRRLQTAGERLNASARLLKTLGYTETLARGYALVLHEDHRLLSRAAEVRDGERLTLRFADGDVVATAGNEATGSKIRRKTAGKPASQDRFTDEQGSLF